MISKTAMLSLVKELRWHEIQEALDENPSLIGVRDKRGRTWLHLCCGIDISKRDGTAGRDTIKVAEILLRHGLDINDAAFTEGHWKATPLWYAIAFGKNLDLARYLLRHESDPNHCLFAAAYNNDCAAIRLLLKNGAAVDPEVEDATPFLFAVQWSRFEAAEELLKLGADPNYQNSRETTALHLMLKKGTDKKYVRMILDYGARLDIKNKEGLTAAAIIAKKRDPEFRKLLPLG
jgi:ankyrin repeat protein